MQQDAERWVAMLERNRGLIGPVGGNERAYRDAEKAVERNPQTHPHAAHGTLQKDAVAADFDDTRAVVRPLVGGGEPNRKRKGVEPRSAARPARERFPARRALKPQC